MNGFHKNFVHKNLDIIHELAKRKRKVKHLIKKYHCLWFACWVQYVSLSPLSTFRVVEVVSGIEPFAPPSCSSGSWPPSPTRQEQPETSETFPSGEEIPWSAEMYNLTSHSKPDSSKVRNLTGYFNLSVAFQMVQTCSTSSPTRAYSVSSSAISFCSAGSDPKLWITDSILDNSALEEEQKKTQITYLVKTYWFQMEIGSNDKSFSKEKYDTVFFSFCHIKAMKFQKIKLENYPVEDSELFPTF